MEPEDNRHIFSRQTKRTMQSSSESSDNYWQSVQEIQTTRRRRKRTAAAIMAQEHHHHHHHCSPSSSSSMSLGKTLLFSTSSSSSPLVVFLFTSALLLFVCISPCQSLPFDGRSLSSGSSSYRSQVDLMIDPIHQAEFGDEDSYENTRVVKSVFDMVLRTPSPPTRCPPGTQSPFDGAPCIKRNTGPVALVDENFLLDTLRGLAKEGLIPSEGKQKTRRPGGGGSGNNRRRTSGRPGSRTTPSTTTTEAPSTTIDIDEESDLLSPTTTFSSAAGDNTNVNTGDEDLVVTAITDEPIVETTPSASAGNEEAAAATMLTESPVNEAASSSSSSEQLPASRDTTAPETATVVTEFDVTTSVAPMTTSTEPSHLKNGVDLRRTAVPDTAEQQVPSSSSSETGNDEQILLESVAATTPTTFIDTPATTTTSVFTTLTDEEQMKEKQEKSGQVQREPVPTIVTTMSSTPISDQQNKWLSEPDANNNATGTLVNPTNEAIIMQHNDQGGNDASQISLESEQENSHSNPHQPISLDLTTQSAATLSSEVTSTEPTFPKEEFLLKTVDMISQTEPHPQHQQQDRENVTTDSTTSPTTFAATTAPSPTLSLETDEKMMTTVNPIPSGAENHNVTGVILASDYPNPHQEEKSHANSTSQRVNASLPQSPEIHTWYPENRRDLEEEEGSLSAKMMTTRMMKVTNSETSEDEQQHEQLNKDGNNPTIFPSSHASDTLQEPKESQLSDTTVQEKEPEQLNQDGSPTASPLPLAEQESWKKLHEIVPQQEATMNASIQNEKALGLMGSLEEKTETESNPIPTEPVVVVQEQHPREQVVQEKDEAGDMTSRTGDDEQAAKGINEAEAEQGDDGEIYAGKSAIVVNHLKDGDEGDKGKETVTLQEGDTDITIINGNLPSVPTSVSPVHDNPKMPVEDSSVLDVNGKDESFGEKNLGSREQQHEGLGDVSDEGARDQLLFTGVQEQPSLDTTLVPPAPTTGAPSESYPHHTFQLGDTLLQFQLPIVTRTPNAAFTEDKEDNEAESFQDFPEFPPVTGAGKLRFPNSAEENIESANLQKTFKPLFVQDFHLDYPPRQETPSAAHEQQQWEIPRTFHSTEILNDTLHHQPSPQHSQLPDYYDSGSTEYLESELDRMHQKTRSRNRNRAQEPVGPSTTNAPLLPPDLSLLSTQQAPSSPPQHQYHHQPSMYFARRNPSADLIPFGYLNFRTGHERFHHNNRRLVW